jgi:hypothetical protein
MPNLAEHFGVLQPSERLFLHNIGVRSIILGLLTQYNNTITSYKPDASSIRWNVLDASAGVVRDFCFDLREGLLFVLTDQYVICLKLRNGQQVWKKSATGMAYIACSPEYKWIYLADNTNKKLKRYDYQLNFLNEVSYGVGYGCNKPVVDDRYDLVILTWKVGSISTYSTTLSLISTFSDITPYSKPALAKDNKIYFMAGSSLCYSLNNNISARTQIQSVGQQQSWDITFTVEDDFAYIPATNNYGNPSTSYFLNKIDLVNKQIVWTKSIEYTNTGYLNNEYIVTHDKNFVYYLINPRTASDGINKVIVVVNKSDGEINKTVPLNPDGYFNDPFIMAWHTYDSVYSLK